MRFGRAGQVLLPNLVGLLLVPLSAGGQEVARDLQDLLDPGFVLEDRNEDGHVDFVRVRLVVPEDAGEAEVAAAANVAARVTFESYGTDLDLLARDAADSGSAGIPLVVVGRARRIWPRATRGSGNPTETATPRWPGGFRPTWRRGASPRTSPSTGPKRPRER